MTQQRQQCPTSLRSAQFTSPKELLGAIEGANFIDFKSAQGVSTGQQLERSLQGTVRARREYSEGTVKAPWPAVSQ